MTIIMTKPEFESLPESEQWAIVYNLEPKPEPKPSEADRQLTQVCSDSPIGFNPPNQGRGTGG
jgi:hypothetical protein